MSTPPVHGDPPQSARENAADIPESQGGAGMAEEGAPIGFTADVGGKGRSTDDPEEVREAVVPAAEHGPRTDGERSEQP